METKLPNYDLEDRTAKFGEEIIILCKTVKETTISRPIISQLIRSGTSVGANYREANGASSRKDFANKIFIAKKESQETQHWLRMLAAYCPELKEKLSKLWKEAKELSMIFNKIANSTRKSN